MLSRRVVLAGLGLLVGSSCAIPNALVVAAPQATYVCDCSCGACAVPTSTCQCAVGSEILGTQLGATICESDPSRAVADCAAACAAAAGPPPSAGCAPSCGPGANPPVLLESDSCSLDTPPVSVLGGGVLNSYLLSVGPGSTLAVSDTSTGSSASTAVAGTLAYTLDGQGGITLNEIALQFAPFVIDFSPVTNLAVVSQAPGTGTIAGTNVSFPGGSLLVTISGDVALPHSATNTIEVAEPGNDGDVSGNFDPASNSFTLSVSSKESDFSAGATFNSVLTLQGTYAAFPPVSVPGGPYQGSACGATVHLDGSASTDGDGAKSLTAFQWFEGNKVIAVGAVADVALPVGSHSLTLRVFNSVGEFADAATTVEVAAAQPPVIVSVTDNQPCLAPPNHKLVRYELGNRIQVQVQDACDPNPTVRIVSVESNATGWEAKIAETAGASAFCVRSETNGSRGGRVYTVGLQATDSSGLSSAVVTTTIEVPAGNDRDEPGDGNDGSGGWGDDHGDRDWRGGHGGGAWGGGSGWRDPGPGPDAGAPLSCPTLPHSAFLKDGDPRCDFSSGSTGKADGHGGLHRAGDCPGQR